MQERNCQIDGINYRHTFSWVTLFQGFRVAFSPRMWLIAAVGVMIWVFGEWVIAQVGFAPEDDGPKLAEMEQWPWNEHAPIVTPPGTPVQIEIPDGEPISVPTPVAKPGINPFGWVSAPNRDRFLAPATEPIVAPLMGMFRPASEFTWSNITYHLTRLLWAFCVWSFIAGILTRKAALKYTTEYSLGIREGVKHILPRWGQYFRAGGLPLAGIALFWLVCYLGGLIGRIPVLGEWIVGLLWIFALLLGFFMALMVIGLLVGWPLMIATISVEDTESFDGFSRGFNYVFNLPWHYGWLGLVSILYGAIVISVVSLIVTLMFSTTITAASSGLGTDQTKELIKGLTPGATDGPLWAEMAGVWGSFVTVLFSGFLYSLFWTMVTLSYLLLRYYDDGMDIHEIAIPPGSDPDAAPQPSIPTVGVADSDQPVIERPSGEINVVQISDPPESEPEEPAQAEEKTDTETETPTEEPANAEEKNDEEECTES